MRIASVALLALVSSVALAGCGSDGGGITISKDRPTTTSDSSSDDGDGSDRSADERDALISYVVGADSTIMDDSQGECVADSAISDLSDDAFDTFAAGGDFDLSKFSKSDAKAIVAGLDECVDIKDALAAFSEGISSEAGLPITEDEAACTSKEFAAEYDGAGQFIEAISSMSEDESGAKLFEAMGPCLSDETATAFMSSLLVDQGMDQALSDCVAQNVVGELGAEGLLKAISEAGTSGGSKALNDASASAGASCAASGLGGAGGGTVTVPPIGGGLSGN
ncbi:MAG: hypothetical protein U0Q22_07000 [Acidimicrobiales bacterium]